MDKTCLLGGKFTYDSIYQREYPSGFVIGKRNKFVDNLYHQCVGGTCGNISSMLPYLGVQTFPIGHFDTSDEGRAMKADLEFYGADTRFIWNSWKGGTTRLNCIHITDDLTGAHRTIEHYSSTNSQHTSYKTLRVDNEAPELLAKLDFVPDVFFFDVSGAGFRYLAQQLREKGTLVFFEPDRFTDMRDFETCISVSDVVKFSFEEISDSSFCEKYPDKLFIITLGNKGLKFKLGSGEWNYVAAPIIDEVVDEKGAGDWLTSKFIALLCENEFLSFSDFTEYRIRELLVEASKTAARSVLFLTPKGMIDAEAGRRNRIQITDDEVPTCGIIGAICGDIIGSKYEQLKFRTKKTNFKLFPADATITDDTTMTLAVAKWLTGERTDERLIDCMVEFGQMCTIYRYGRLFRNWLSADVRAPYGAESNGSAMRVSAVGWVATSLEECLQLAKQTADVSHNSKSGERGAMSVAAAVYMARNGRSKSEIKNYIEGRFGYDLSRSIEDIRKSYVFSSMADESVPEAIICWLQSSTYEKAVRNAVALGGDADTQAAIAGAIAAATPGMEVPKEIAVTGLSYLSDSLKQALIDFEDYLKRDI